MNEQKVELEGLGILDETNLFAFIEGLIEKGFDVRIKCVAANWEIYAARKRE